MQFSPGIGRGEAPLDRGTGQIALRLREGDAALERCLIADALIETLPGQHRQYNLHQVQLAAVQCTRLR